MKENEGEKQLSKYIEARKKDIEEKMSMLDNGFYSFLPIALGFGVATFSEDRLIIVHFILGVVFGSSIIFSIYGLSRSIPHQEIEEHIKQQTLEEKVRLVKQLEKTWIKKKKAAKGSLVSFACFFVVLAVSIFVQ